MTDREYLKFNTSIHTGSNAENLRYDDKGNIEATIELRLPDNLYNTQNGAQKVDNVQMQTSKFRVSMSETPIAEIPLKTEKNEILISSCEMDVYPYAFTGINTIEPHTEHPDDVRAFSDYKHHEIDYHFLFLATPTKSDERDPFVIHALMNTKDHGVPKDSIYYNLLVKAKIIEETENHIMNLAITRGYHKVKTNDSRDKIVIYDIAGIEQMLADAFANAVTFAGSGIKTDVSVYLVDVTEVPDFYPEADVNNCIEYYGRQWCYWKHEIQIDNNFGDQNLRNEFKPQVSIDESSLTISYDTASFKNVVPILWNTSFVQNYERAIQTIADEFLRNAIMPPVKRQYQYGVTKTSDPNQYMFSLLDHIECAVFNIIANKTLKDTYSFLPWIEIDFQKIAENNQVIVPTMYHVTERERYEVYVEAKNVNVTVDETTQIKTRHNGYDYSDREYGPYLPEYGKYIMYIYDLPEGVEDEPRNREKQLILTNGISTEETHVKDAGSVVFDPGYTVPGHWINPPPPHIIEETNTSDPGYPLGTTLVDTSTSSSERVEDTGTYHEAEWMLWALCRGDSGEVETLQTWPDMGTWNPNSEYKYAPYQDPYEIIRLADPGLNIRRYLRIYMMPQGDDFDTNYDAVVYPRITRRLDYTVRRTTTTYDEIIVEELEPEHGIIDYNLIPNLTDYTDKFYALDGTTCKVNIGTQEPVVNGHLFQITETVNNSDGDVYKRDTFSYGSNTNPNVTSWRTVAGKTLVVVSPLPAHYWSHMIYYMYDYDPEHPNTKLNQGVYIGEESTYYITTNDGVFSIDIESHEMVEPPPNTETFKYSDDTSLTPGTTTSTEIITSDYEYLPTETQTLTGLEQRMYFSRAIIPSDNWKPRMDGTNGLYSRVREITGSIRNDTEIRYYPRDWTPNETFERNVIGSSLKRRYMIWRMNYQESDKSYNMWIGQRSGQMYISGIIQKSYTQTKTTVIEESPDKYIGNVRLSFTWENLPIVVLSPIQSIVLTLDGMNVSKEVYPINAVQPTGSSLISTIPVVENYFSMASTLRDLHDELVVVKDSFEDTPTYTVSNNSGKERTITLSAKYITKDGRLHQLYIPPNGVFVIQLTFGISFYY